ncbi:hypothetical protein BgiBS90_008265 [Biomphalaria glabrata]|nr:hypothetical protein BgiBS90_008265 [Biomphalaria glabrata]
MIRRYRGRVEHAQMSLTEMYTTLTVTNSSNGLPHSVQSIENRVKIISDPDIGSPNNLCIIIQRSRSRECKNESNDLIDIRVSILRCGAIHPGMWCYPSCDVVLSILGCGAIHPGMWC